jgi:hypothetical protein
MSATNAIAYNGLVIWPTRDQDGYYAEITNRQGQEIHTILDSYETEAQAVQAAREWIDQNGQRAV